MLSFKQAKFLTRGLKMTRRVGTGIKSAATDEKVVSSFRKAGKTAKSIWMHPNTFGTTLLAGYGLDSARQRRERRMY
jgi:hypothetical protein